MNFGSGMSQSALKIFYQRLASLHPSVTSFNDPPSLNRYKSRQTFLGFFGFMGSIDAERLHSYGDASYAYQHNYEPIPEVLHFVT
jgi:hypothetical protein